jgi:protein ImuB
MKPYWLALCPQDPQRVAGRDAQAAPTGAAAWADPLAALAWWSLQFTPWVAQVQQALVLEISASERLFGGRTALLQALLQPGQAPLPMQYAHGDSALLALARLACDALQHADDLVRPPLAPDALPLHTLAAAHAHLPTLERLGCTTWGQLRALPRAGVARRFGAPLLTALDQAYGTAPEVYAWLRLPEVFDAPLELAAQVESASAMLFGARRLLAQLQLWLRARQHGVLALELRWQLDARRANARHRDAWHQGDGYGRLHLRTAEPTQDPRHLERLLAEHLAQVTLPAPVLYLRLRTLETCALRGHSLSLLPDELRSGDSLHHLLERVAARLGPESVRAVTLQDDHRAECMQSWQALGAQAQGAAHGPSARPRDPAPPNSEGDAQALYPTWLLPQARSLPSGADGLPEYHGPLALLAGPQRLEQQAWDLGPQVQRDYYIAHSPDRGLLWVYRERLGAAQGQGAAWYLHGWFA